MSRRRVARSAQHSPRLRRQGYLRPQVESLEKRSLLAMVDFLSLPSDGGVPPGLAGRPEDVGHDRPPAIVGREESDLAYLARRVPSHELPLLDKVNTQLLTLYSRHLQGQPSDVTRQVINNMPLERLWVQRNGVPQIRAYVTDVGVALEELEALGLESSGTLDTERWKIIEGYLPVPALRDAARITGLTYLDVAIQPHANASGSAANEWETVSAPTN